ncbi:NUDIX hydrolase [Streptosporangium sp. NPDC000396]|uniref:NUDIX hydrolase n=1 Tax=Streptosporangium sp. NPDC000396 TaxID=3366185 RepID=UPI0036C20D79
MNETPRDTLQWELIGESGTPGGYRKVGSRTYRYPDGHAGDWDILEGGRTVAVVALTDDGQAVMVAQFRPGPGRVLAELPGGDANTGESVEAAAERELLEETGYKASSVEVVAETYLASYATHVRYGVLARGCRRVAAPSPQGAEFLRVETVPLDAFVDHVLSGAMTDMDMGLAGLIAAGVFTRG